MPENSDAIHQADLTRIREAIQQIDISERLACMAPEAARRMQSEAQRVLDEQIMKLSPRRASWSPGRLRRHGPGSLCEARGIGEPPDGIPGRTLPDQTIDRSFADDTEFLQPCGHCPARTGAALADRHAAVGDIHPNVACIFVC